MKAPKAIVEYDGTEVECNVVTLQFYEDSRNLSGIDVVYYGMRLPFYISLDGILRNRHGNMTAKLIEE